MDGPGLSGCSRQLFARLCPDWRILSQTQIKVASTWAACSHVHRPPTRNCLIWQQQGFASNFTNFPSPTAPQPFVLWQRCICKICIWSWRSICSANTFLPSCLLHYERCSCKTSTSCLSIARRQDCRRRRNGFAIM